MFSERTNAICRPSGDHAGAESRAGFVVRRCGSPGPTDLTWDREAVYDVRVVDVPLARIGLYERTVLLISGTALELLPAEDLRAQVAHELGHEYFATEHDRATQAGDQRRLSELELMCDAVGMVMLQKLGMDPSRLMRSIEMLTLYNRQVFQTAMDESGYPTLDERRKFADAVRRWLAKRKAGGSHAPDGSMPGTSADKHERNRARGTGSRSGYQPEHGGDLATTMRCMHLSPAAKDSAIRLLDRPAPSRRLETFWKRRIPRSEK